MTKRMKDGEGASAPVLSKELRIELLRLVHRHDVGAEQIIERSKALEAYVLSDQPADKP